MYQHNNMKKSIYTNYEFDELKIRIYRVFQLNSRKQIVRELLFHYLLWKAETITQ